VLVDDDVAAVVVALLEQPREYALGIGGIGNSRVAGLAEQTRHVGRADRAPVNLAIGLLGPSLDSREPTLDARPKAMDHVSVAHLFPDLAFIELRHEILGAGEDE